MYITLWLGIRDNVVLYEIELTKILPWILCLEIGILSNQKNFGSDE